MSFPSAQEWAEADIPAGYPLFCPFCQQVFQDITWNPCIREFCVTTPDEEDCNPVIIAQQGVFFLEPTEHPGIETLVIHHGH